ncbi:hypothetical protein Dimus_037341, partial [Dionaea muscipula]
MLLTTRFLLRDERYDGPNSGRAEVEDGEILEFPCVEGALKKVNPEAGTPGDWEATWDGADLDLPRRISENVVSRRRNLLHHEGHRMN